MMKKVLYGVAIALLAGASVGTLQSCKDDVSDLKTQTAFDLEQLRKDLAGVHQGLQDQITNNRNDVNKLFHLLDQYAKVTWVEQMLANLQENIYKNIQNIGSQISHINGEIVRINGEISTLQGKVDYLTQEDAKLLAMIQSNLRSINDLNDKYTTLNGKVDALQTKYDALETSLDQLTTVVNGLKGQVDQNTLDIAALDSRVTANELAISTINSVLNQIQGDIAGLDQKIDNLDERFSGEINLINGKLQVIDGKIDEFDVRLNGIDASIAGLTSDVAGLQDAVDAINTTLNGVTVKIDSLEGRVGALEENVLILNDNVSDLIEKVYFLKKDITDLRNDFETLSGDVAALTQLVNTFDQRINDLSTRLDNTLTGLLLQATDSPVFGNFSLPIGVKSTLLFNWYGDNKTGIEEFPVYEYTSEYEFDHQNVDFAFDGSVAPERVMDGVIGDVDLGTVYISLNPLGHYFDNNNFAIVNSKGEQLPVAVEVAPSNDLLTFGFSRDRDKIDSNVYAAKVSITGDEDARSKGVQASRIEIDENLKSAAKEVLKDRSKRSAVGLLKAVYGQLDGMLPAYALSYNWEDGNNACSVLSNYDLAVATARPLSYNFYQGNSINYRLRKYGHINNVLEQLRGKFKIEFTPISFENITINFPPIVLDESNVVAGTTKVTAPIEPIKIIIDGKEYWTEPSTVEVNIEDVVGSIVEDFNGAINDMIGEIEGWSETAKNQINADLKGQLQPIADQINGMVENLQGQIDSMVNDVINKAEPWFQRLNRVVDLYNRVADKVNNVLENPNHYLQVAMFYNQKNNGVGMLSNSLYSPTPFGAGNGVITLYASSYSGEIVCPAFKKYVACTKVYDMNGNPAAQESTLRSKMNDKAEFFNKVMDGYTIRFDVPTSAIEKNYIYEITYQGLDYSGVTSTQKFYITVK